MNRLRKYRLWLLLTAYALLYSTIAGWLLWHGDRQPQLFLQLVGMLFIFGLMFWRTKP